MDSIWAQHEAVIRHLYQIERKTLKQVKEILESQYGFPEKPLAQYETGLRDVLGFRKKLKAEHWPMVFSYAMSKGYGSFDVYIGDTRIPWKRAWKEIRRSGAHKMTANLGDQEELPPGVRIQAMSSHKSIPRAVASRNIPIQAASSQSTTVILTSGRRPAKLISGSSSRTGQFTPDHAIMSNALVQREKAVPPALPSHTSHGGSSPNPSSWDMSNFAKSLLDTLPWHQYRLASYAVLVAGKRSEPAFETCGYHSFAIMPVDKFCPHSIGQRTARVSNSSYPSLSDVLSLRESLTPLASNFDIYHFLATMTYLVSNDLVPNGELLVDIIDILQSGVSRNIVIAFFNSGLDSTRAVWDTLFHATARIWPRRGGFRVMHFLVEVLLSSQCSWFEEEKNWVLWQVALTGHVDLTQRLLSLGAVLDYREAAHDRVSIIAAASREDESCAAVLIEHCDTNANLKSFRCEDLDFDGILPCYQCGESHLDPDAPISHFSLFLNSAMAEPQQPIEEYEKVLCMLINSGADVDLVFFNSPTLRAYRHGGIENIPWSWMPTCLDVCYYWNRPLFHRLKPHSSKINECLTRAGACEAALAGEDVLTEYLETASAYSTTEKTRFLELVVIENFLPPTPDYAPSRTPGLATDVVYKLINFGVFVVPWNFATLNLTPQDNATRIFVRLASSAASHGCNDNNIFVMRHLYQHTDIDKLKALYSVVKHAGTDVLQALSFVISSDLVTNGAYILARAVSANNTEAVSWLLDNGVDVNSEVRTTDDNYLTILGQVSGTSILVGTSFCGWPTDATLRHLIERGAHFRRQTIDTNCYELLRSVLFPASEHFPILYRLLTEHSAELERVTEDQWQDLIIHCARSLERHTTDRDRRPAPMVEMFDAVYLRHSPVQLGPVLAGYIGGGGSDLMIQELLARGASINECTDYFTPLQAAAARGNAPLVAQLLDLGADINASGRSSPALVLICSWKALSPSDCERKTTIITLLLDKGASIDGADHFSTPLQHCAELGDIANASLLVQRGAKLNICSPVERHLGYTLESALDKAAWNGRLDMTRYLLGLGALSACPGSTGYEGALKKAHHEPFHSHRDQKHVVVAKLIESHSNKLAKLFEQDPRMFAIREAGIQQHKSHIKQTIGNLEGRFRDGYRPWF